MHIPYSFLAQGNCMFSSTGHRHHMNTGNKRSKCIESHTWLRTALAGQIGSPQHAHGLHPEWHGLSFLFNIPMAKPASIARSCSLQLYDRLKHQQRMFNPFPMPLVISIHHFIRLHQYHKSFICE